MGKPACPLPHQESPLRLHHRRIHTPAQREFRLGSYRINHRRLRPAQHRPHRRGRQEDAEHHRQPQPVRQTAAHQKLLRLDRQSARSGRAAEIDSRDRKQRQQQHQTGSLCKGSCQRRSNREPESAWIDTGREAHQAQCCAPGRAGIPHVGNVPSAACPTNAESRSGVADEGMVAKLPDGGQSHGVHTSSD